MLSQAMLIEAMAREAYKRFDAAHITPWEELSAQKKSMWTELIENARKIENLLGASEPVLENEILSIKGPTPQGTPKVWTATRFDVPTRRQLRVVHSEISAADACRKAVE